jgi:molybdate transport system substrate-binding protein
VLQAMPLVAAVATAGEARAATTDLVVNCDTVLAPAIAAAARAFRNSSGVRIDIFPTPPGLILPQLARTVQNDIVMTSPARLEQASQQGLTGGGQHSSIWRNRLMLAAQNGAAAAEKGAIAVPDPTPGSDIDGPEVVARLGLRTASVRGVIDSSEAAWLLGNGAVAMALLPMTELRADSRLAVLRPVPQDVAPPLLCAAAVTTLARRPNPEAFVAFLNSPAGRAVLQASGLEAAS